MPSRVLLENSDVRVTRWTLSGAEDTGLHRHAHDYVVVPLDAARMRVTAAAGDTSVHALEKGVPYFREAGAEHTVGSDDGALLDFVEVELLRQAR